VLPQMLLSTESPITLILIYDPDFQSPASYGQFVIKRNYAKMKVKVSPFKRQSEHKRMDGWTRPIAVPSLLRTSSRVSSLGPADMYARPMMTRLTSETAMPERYQTAAGGAAPLNHTLYQA